MNARLLTTTVLFSAALLFNGCSTEKSCSKECCAPQKNQSSSETTPAVSTPEKTAVTNASADAKKLSGSVSLFDGKTLTGWKITDFGGHGEITVENETIKIDMGAELSGINWTNASVLPHQNYELELDAMKVQGNDFFCGLTFPVGTNFCSFIVGGWGGGIVGISSIDHMDASENETSKNRYFEKNRWYHIRVQVTPQKIKAWIDDENLVDVDIAGRNVSMRPGEIELSAPLGIATWQTSSVVKNIRLKTL